MCGELACSIDRVSGICGDHLCSGRLSPPIKLFLHLPISRQTHRPKNVSVLHIYDYKYQIGFLELLVAVNEYNFCSDLSMLYSLPFIILVQTSHPAH